MASVESTTGATVQSAAISSKTSHPSKPKRPNFNVIHADPLPITLYHAPPLIPHNPLSLLHHLYLYLFPPASSHSVTYTGTFSAVTLSVEVTDPTAILDLWRRGFWGKGSLSRSEPTWLHRELRRLGDINVGETSEEITRRRREQRKEMKKQRAKKEKEELQKVKEAEANKASNDGSANEKPIVTGSKVVVNLEEEIKGLIELEDVSHLQPGDPTENTGLPTPPLSVSDGIEITNAGCQKITLESTSDHDSAALPLSEPTVAGVYLNQDVPTKADDFSSKSGNTELPVAKRVIVDNQEHLQLTLVEAFFLAYALGVLCVTTKSSPNPLSIADLFRLFLQHSTFPPLPQVSLIDLDTDNKFLVNYVAYHHFRSLGWVVKTGIKFSVDYLLYKRGPVFSHAEFGVLIIPSYSRWEGRKDVAKEWYWLHSITRVNSQVKKTVVLAYVDIPPPEEVRGWDCKEEGLKKLLGRYRVKEVALRRWIPGRNRD